MNRRSISQHFQIAQRKIPDEENFDGSSGPRCYLRARTGCRYGAGPAPLHQGAGCGRSELNWTGFYIGGFAGGASADRKASSTEPASAGGAFYNGPLTNIYSLSNSVIAGGTVGYNYQPVGSNWLIGLEGEAGYIHVARTIQDINAINVGFAFPDSLDTTRIGNWYGVAAARVGFTADRFLVYGKGGAAFVEKNYAFSDTCTIAPCGPSQLVLGRNNNTDVTWAAGGGVE